ncbi:hypothetical protein EZS27_001323 [termite gut metagenome]|uniref:TonB-dependent receptor plug domain-containing protein n=1 Tax=termite gut metagenome TaxID=433724 RepID=A0A5J4T1L9_9ZZZZ
MQWMTKIETGFVIAGRTSLARNDKKRMINVLYTVLYQKIMKQKYYFLVFSLIFPVVVHCRNNPENLMDSIRNHFIQQVQLFPQEKIYIQTDKSEYISGETLWFKVYLTDAVVHLPSEQSRFVYVELINPLDVVEKREKVKIAPGQSCGQIKIPTTFPEGNYTLRAYSGTMFGMSENYFFHKNTYIHSLLSTHVTDTVAFAFEKDKVTASIRLEKNNKGIHTKQLKVRINEDTQKTLQTNNEGNVNFSFKLSGNSKKRVMYIEWEELDYFFSKYIFIPYPEETYTLSFFPEGGNLLEETSCKIAFKAIKSNGLAENITGYILDNDSNVVVSSFQSFHKGMGNFTLISEPGKTYYAVVKNGKNIERRFQLPNAVKGAYSLSAQGNEDKVRLFVKHSADMQPDDSLFLIVHSRGIVEYAALWNPSLPYISLKTDNFPSGILQVLLLDKYWNPLSERLLFCLNPNDFANLSFKVNKEKFNPRESVVLDLNLCDNEGNPLVGNFSLSVTNDNEVTVDTTSNILSSLLLTSDLKGYIEEPAFYFQTDNPFRNKALDNLMLTQGWRRYNLPEIMKGNWETSPGFIELGQEISGSVKGLILKKGIANSRVSLLSLDNGYTNEVTTDDKGNFTINGLDFPNNTDFVVQVLSKKGNDRLELSIKEDEFPSVEPVFFSISTMEQISSPKILMQENIYWTGEEFINGTRIIHLREVEVKAKRKENSTDAYFRMADNSFDQKKIEEIGATCIHELLRRIPGVVIQDEKVIIRGTTSIYGKPYAAIAIDGVIVESFDAENDFDKNTDFDLDQINMMDIERVDVYKTGNSIIWGARGGKGVVSFTTKKGNFDPSKIDKTRFNTKRIKPLGYIVPDEFYSPRYETETQKANFTPDLRSTLFWKPNTNTDEDGKASLDFYTSDNISSYSVVVEGITNKGLIIHKVGQVNSYGN